MKKVLLISMIMISLGVFSIILIVGCSSRDLKTAIQKKDTKTIKETVYNLVQQNDEKSLKVLIDALDLLGTPPEPTAYWVILEGMVRFTNKDVISKMADFILNNKNKALGIDLLSVMKSNRSTTIVPLLDTILEKGTYEMQKEAIYQLGSIPTKESLEALFNFLRPFKDDDKKDTIKGPLIKDVIYYIQNITNHDLGNYPEAWIRWWDENKNKDASELIRIRPKERGSIVIDPGYPFPNPIGKEKVIVVRNDKCDKTNSWDLNYDHMQDILTLLGIEHTVVGKSEFDKESYSLDDKSIVIFNCNYWKDHCCAPRHKDSVDKKSMLTQRQIECAGDGKTPHYIHNTKLSDKTIKKIKDFVETGGYLFTEDLNIEEIIERAFPGYITHTKYLPEQEVKILPAPGAALHPYLRYVFEALPSSTPQTPSEGKSSETTSVKEGELYVEGRWKIDNESADIKILNREKVTVLLVSPQLAKANKNEGAVAVTWGYSADKLITTNSGSGPAYAGGGRVLHVMSHLGKQRSKIDEDGCGEFVLQNLLVNFLEELDERRPKARVKK